MTNAFYNHGSYPSTGAAGSSASLRAEFDAVTAGFNLLPTLAAMQNQIVRVNSSGTALEASGIGLAGTSGKTLTVSNSLTLAGTDGTVLTGPGASDTLVGLAATQTLTNKTLLAATNNVEATSGPNGSAFTFRNRFINGDMRIDQRNSGAAINLTAATYSYDCDRMLVAVSTGSAATAQRVAIGGTGPNGEQGGFGQQISGAASVTNPQIGQRIEAANSRDMAGGNATLSCWVWQNSGGSLSTGATVQRANSTDNFGAFTLDATLTCTPATVPTNTWTKVTCTGAISTGGTTGLWPILVLSGSLPVSTICLFSYFQFEKGSVATPFENRPIGVELAQCQRYCWSTLGLLLGQAKDTSELYSTILANPVPMRANPAFQGSFTVSTGNAGSPVLNYSRIVGADGTKSASIYNGSSNWTATAWVSINGVFSAEL